KNQKPARIRNPQMSASSRQVLTEIMMDAFARNKEDIVNSCLDRGADPAVLFEKAIEKKNLALAKRCLVMGADFKGIPFQTLRDTDRNFYELALERRLYAQEFFNLALEKKDVKLLCMALDAGADIERGQPSPLFQALADKHPGMVEALLKRGANVNV